MERRASTQKARGGGVLAGLFVVLLALFIALGAAPAPARAVFFPDVPSNAWYATWVNQAAGKGLMSGYDAGPKQGQFGPDDTVTRAQVAMVLWRMAGSPETPASSFPDVPAGQWYTSAVAWCAKAGIVTGYRGGSDAGKFAPDRQVSRQELAVMAWRFAKWAGVDVSNPDPSAFESTTDWRSVESWASDALTWTAAAGVLSGVENPDGTRTVDPSGTATRAQAAKIFVVLSGRPSAPKASYTVTFEPNGGSAVKAQTVANGAKVAKPADPAKTGYTFEGWFSDKGLTKAYDFGAAVESNVTLYAKWASTGDICSVIFISNGGSVPSTQLVVCGESAIKPDDPTMVGYTFAGWYSDENLTKAYDFNSVIVSDIILYAKWDVDFSVYTVTFEPNGGSAVKAQTVSCGYTVSKPADPTKEGYIFKGWYSDESLIQAYDFDDAVKSDLTLYAKWETIPVYAVLYSDGLLSLQRGEDTDSSHGEVLASWEWSRWSGDRPWTDKGARVKSVVVRDAIAVGGNANQLFNGLANCTSMDLTHLDVSSSTSLAFMFFGCSSLESLDLSGWDVSSVMDLSDMFRNCSSLTTLDLSGWDVSKATNLSWMFDGCSSLQSLDLSGWKVTSATDLRYIFHNCKSLKSLDLSGWDASWATSLTDMFAGCSSLRSLNLSGWDVSWITDFSWMFYNCSSLETLNISGWSVSSATDFSYMFCYCSSLESLDLSGWNMSKATDLSNMFDRCTSLSEVTLSAGCAKLVSLLPSGRWYDASGNSYSRIPSTALPGTFTRKVAAAQEASAEVALFDDVAPLAGAAEGADESADAEVTGGADDPASSEVTFDPAEAPDAPSPADSEQGEAAADLGQPSDAQATDGDASQTEPDASTDEPAASSDSADAVEFGGGEQATEEVVAASGPEEVPAGEAPLDAAA